MHKVDTLLVDFVPFAKSHDSRPLPAQRLLNFVNALQAAMKPDNAFPDLEQSRGKLTPERKQFMKALDKLFQPQDAKGKMPGERITKEKEQKRRGRHI